MVSFVALTLHLGTCVMKWKFWVSK